MSSTNKIVATFRLLRVHQWVKNLFVLVPAFFALVFDEHTVAPLLIGTLGFCLISSSSYVINDIFDREADAQHPKKKNRPIASGALTVKEARLITVALFGGAIGCALSINTAYLLIMLSYFGVVLAYSAILKKIPVVDVIIISTGFLLRIYAGAAIVEVFVSEWLFIITALLSLFLGLGKRRGELTLLQLTGIKSRAVITSYSPKLVNYSIVILGIAIGAFYLFYTFSDEVAERVKSDHLYLTSLFVWAGISRYLYLVLKKGLGEEPAKIILKDWILIIVILSWIAMFGFLLYGSY